MLTITDTNVIQIELHELGESPRILRYNLNLKIVYNEGGISTNDVDLNRFKEMLNLTIKNQNTYNNRLIKGYVLPGENWDYRLDKDYDLFDTEIGFMDIKEEENKEEEEEEEKIVCSECSDEIEDGDQIKLEDGTIICDNEDYYTCNECSEKYNDEESWHIETEEIIVCNSCIDNFSTCSDCHNMTRDSNLYNTENGHVCHDCRESYFSCESCGDVIHEDNSCYSENTGSSYCEGCYPGENTELYEFSGKIETDGTGQKIGVEIEVSEQDEEKHSSIDSQGLFTAVEDGSLSDGIEYNSPILRESNYKEILTNFCDNYLDEASINADCGLHIHLDCSNKSWYDMALFFEYCKKYEDFFFAVVPKSRQYSNYCTRLPVFKTPKCKADMIKFLYGHNKKQNQKYPNSDGGCINRYFWCNIHSYFFRRTIEIRLHSGTTQAKKIINWIDLFIAVLNHAIKGKKQWVHPLELLNDDTRQYFESRQTKFS